MKFVDEVNITVASGKGGPGKVSFRKEAMTPRGGPDGGDGGRGGNLVFKVSDNLNSLVDYRRNKAYKAQDGTPGAGSDCAGPDGADLELLVPRGTVVRNSDGLVLADLTDVDQVILLKGGRGGKGNAFFKTSVNQAPMHAQPGEPAESLDVSLELKLIADVGIIGFPNAGKSTLISRISASKARVADYPFTTLTPNLGVVRVDELRSYVVADIPGLIKGAAQGAGLGVKFLKHIERTRILIHLIDVSTMASGDPVSNYKDIMHEIMEYEKENSGKDGYIPMSTRPQIVAFNKVETLPPEDLKKIVKNFSKELDIEPMTISGVTGLGIKDLLNKVSRFVFQEDQE